MGRKWLEFSASMTQRYEEAGGINGDLFESSLHASHDCKKCRFFSVFKKAISVVAGQGCTIPDLIVRLCPLGVEEGARRQEKPSRTGHRK